MLRRLGSAWCTKVPGTPRSAIRSLVPLVILWTLITLPIVRMPNVHNIVVHEVYDALGDLKKWFAMVSGAWISGFPPRHAKVPQTQPKPRSKKRECKAEGETASDKHDIRAHCLQRKSFSSQHLPHDDHPHSMHLYPRPYSMEEENHIHQLC